MPTDTTLLETPLHDFHVAQGAKMVDFVGWSMPLHYGSILDEHRQVRTSGGYFDVSHMGRFSITGRDARRFLDRVCTRSIATMQDGQARYSLVCNHEGGCRDDVLVYRIADGEYSMVCNASNREKLLQHFDEVRGDLVFKLEDITRGSIMVAVQGPKVMEVIGRYSTEIPNLKRFRFTRINVLGLSAMISRTGYTGEDGVEVIFRTDNIAASMALKLLLKKIDSLDAELRPAGLGARDSLRLEAAMALYGHEITETIDPLSAGLNFAVKLDKEEEDPGGYIGQSALRAIAEEGPKRRLVGLELDSRRSARQDMHVRSGDDVVGFVTSGCLSPTLDASIAMAYVDRNRTDEGTMLSVDLGRQVVDAKVVGLPFVGQ